MQAFDGREDYFMSRQFGASLRRTWSFFPLPNLGPSATSKQATSFLETSTQGVPNGHGKTFKEQKGSI